MIRTLAILLIALALGGCAYYEPVPVPAGPTTQERFDRSWSAATGAMADQGVRVDAQDRGAGVIRGNRNGIAITAKLQTLADGRIQVQFDQSGPTSADPGLIQRVSDSYDRRMGR